MDRTMSLSENKIAEECIEYAILCLRGKKIPLGKDYQWTLKH